VISKERVSRSIKRARRRRGRTGRNAVAILSVGAMLAGVGAIYLSQGDPVLSDVRQVSVTKSPTTALGGWVNGTNAIGQDNVCATDSGGSNVLDLTGFGFSVPTGSSINGITVSVKGARQSNNGGAMDLVILGGATSPSPTASTGTYPVTTACSSTIFVDNGGATQLFGTTFTPAQVNATTFGVRINSGSLTGGGKLASVDHVTVTIHYTASAPPPVSGTLGISPMVSGETSTKPTFSGTGAQHNGGNGRVRVYLDGSDHPATPHCEAVVAAGGTWSCSNNGVTLSAGSHTVHLRQYTDGIATISGPSASTNFTVAAVPSTPVIVSPADAATVAPNASFSGTCTAGSTVTVTLDGSGIGTTTCDGAGNWVFTPGAPMSDGTHSLVVKATNAVGDSSADSPTRTFNVSSGGPPS